MISQMCHKMMMISSNMTTYLKLLLKFFNVCSR